ncbi:hypothetical protein [Nocardioides houyundeii]|uniref:hypothetical protein n=1 Tax=Nocardioides houyundeii TaxID=2045452 RepID=UPI000C758CBF|nr:hypothetical protein [Nocardioides houyundeii]
MTDQSTQTVGSTDVVADRTRAFVAVAVGLVGALGGGSLSNALSALFSSRFLSDVMTEGRLVWMVPLGMLPALIGLVAVMLAVPLRRSPDPLTVPLATTAVVLGSLALAGGLVVAVLGFFQDY